MGENPLLKLQSFGQSIWMDYIRRQLITSGELQRLIEEDGLLGVTSNPSIFDKAIAGSHDYDNSIRAMALEAKALKKSTVFSLWRISNGLLTSSVPNTVSWMEGTDL